MRLYLIRHGQSSNNALTDHSKRVYDPKLTELGEEQVQHLGKFIANEPDFPHESFGITHLYCSAMTRALQTAQPIAQQCDLPMNIWLDVHEIGGLFLAYPDGSEEGFGGLTRTQISEQFPEAVIPDTITEEGWYTKENGHESPPDFLSRAIRVGYEIRNRANKNKDDVIAIVSHAAFLDALMKVLIDQAPRHPNDLFMVHFNTGITRILFNDDKYNNQFSLQYFNRVDHLGSDLRSW